MQAMVVPEELRSAISEVTKHSENHLTGFVLEKGKERQAKKRDKHFLSCPVLSSPLSQEMQFPLKNWDNLPKPETTPLETEACG